MVFLSLDAIWRLIIPYVLLVFLTALTHCFEGFKSFHTGQCKRTGGCYNELVVAFFSTGGGVKGKKNLYLLT